MPEDKLNKKPEAIETGEKDDSVDKLEEVAQRARNGIEQLLQTADLPPDLKRQADQVAREALQEISAIEQIETTFSEVESKERIHNSEVAEVVDNISLLLKNELGKLNQAETKNFRKRLSEWQAQSAEILSSNKKDKKKLEIIRSLFRSKFPELSLASAQPLRTGAEQIEVGSEKEEVDFSGAESWEDIYELIDRFGPIEGGLGSYDPAILKSIIKDVSDHKLDIDYVIITGGLRPKVEQLLKQDEERKEEEKKQRIENREQAKVKVDQEYLDKEGKLKILSAKQLEAISDEALAKIRDVFFVLEPDKDPNLELYFNRVWDEIERRHPEARDKVELLSAEDLSKLSDEEFAKTYHNLIGGKDALFLKYKRTPEESAYFGRLISEVGRRKSIKPEINKKETEQPLANKASVDKEQEQTLDKLPSIIILKDLISRLNRAYATEDRGEKQSVLALAADILKNPSLGKADSHKEINAGIEQAVLAAEDQIHKLEGSSVMEKPEEVKLEIGKGNDKISYELEKYSDGGLVVKKVVSKKEIAVPQNKILVDNWQDYIDNTKLNLPGGSVHQELLLEADVYSLFHKKNILFNAEFENEEDRELFIQDLLKSIIKVEKEYGQVLNPEFKQEISDFISKPGEIEDIESLDSKEKGPAQAVELVPEESVEVTDKKPLWQKVGGIFSKKSQKKETVEIAPVASVEAGDKEENKENLTVNGVKYNLRFNVDGAVHINHTEGEVRDVYEKVLPENWKQLLEHNSALSEDDKKRMMIVCDNVAHSIFVHRNLMESNELSYIQKTDLQYEIDKIIKHWNNNYGHIFKIEMDNEIPNDDLIENLSPEDRVKADKIKSAKSREELMAILEEIGDLKGVNYDYPVKDLKVLIGIALFNKTAEKAIPRNFGLRDKVLELRAKYDEQIVKEVPELEKNNELEVKPEEKNTVMPQQKVEDNQKEEFEIPVFLRPKANESASATETKISEQSPEVEDFVVPEFLRRQPEVSSPHEDKPLTAEEEGVGEVKNYPSVGVDKKNIEEMSQESINTEVPEFLQKDLESEEGISEVKPYNPPENAVVEDNGRKRSKKTPKVVLGELPADQQGFGVPKPYNSEITSTEEVTNNENITNPHEEKPLTEEEMGTGEVKPFGEVKEELVEEKIELPEVELKKDKEVSNISTHVNGVDCQLTFYDDNSVELLKTGLSMRSKYAEDPIKTVLVKNWQKVLAETSRLSGKELEKAKQEVEFIADDLFFKYRIMQRWKDTEDSRLIANSDKLAVDITTRMLDLLHKYGGVVRDDFFQPVDDRSIKEKTVDFIYDSKDKIQEPLDEAISKTRRFIKRNF